MYDWANSAFQTTIIAAVFPIYFHNVVAADLGGSLSTSRFAWATTLAIVIVALVAPLLGAIADYAAMKKRMLGIFVGMGVAATTAMYWIRAGDWVFALTLFIIGNVAVAAQHRVLRIAPPAPGEREGAGPGFLGWICDRLSRWRRAARDQPADDPAAVMVRHPRQWNRRQTVARERRHLVAGVLDSAFSQGARAGAPD